MKGQWTGTYQGTSAGEIVLDLDEEDEVLTGTFTAFENDPSLPGIIGMVTTGKDEAVANLITTGVVPFDRVTSLMLLPDGVAKSFPNALIPANFRISLSREGDTLSAKWQTNIGTEGDAKLERSRADKPSELEVEKIDNWCDFRNYTLGLSPRKFLFRGQGVRNRLRTTFHRSRRKNLYAYMDTIIPEVYRDLTIQTQHLFNLGDPLQNGAFYNLIQHHGFPTPLLDWTYSPFVAAFFSYRRNRKPEEDGDKVRIFMFDMEEWMKRTRQLGMVAPAIPNFSILQALNLENRRALPQQAVSTITNIDDIETYLLRMGRDMGVSFLKAFDLPRAQRRVVMEELRKMGITAASLFPGIDGACEELRGRFFHPL